MLTIAIVVKSIIIFSLRLVSNPAILSYILCFDFTPNTSISILVVNSIDIIKNTIPALRFFKKPPQVKLTIIIVLNSIIIFWLKVVFTLITFPIAEFSSLASITIKYNAKAEIIETIKNKIPALKFCINPPQVKLTNINAVNRINIFSPFVLSANITFLISPLLEFIPYINKNVIATKTIETIKNTIPIVKFLTKPP